MARDRTVQKPNTGRLFEIVNRAIRPDEQRKTAGVVGALLRGENPTGDYLEKLTSPDRDMLLITPQRMVIIRPKPVAALGLRDAIQLRRGNVSTVLEPELSVTRRNVKRIVCSSEAPPHFNVLDMGGVTLTFAKVEIENNGQPETVDFWIDTEFAETPDRLANFQESVEVWFGRRSVAA
jgi:hypothetical protein